MRVETIVRNLARSSYWQHMYLASQENGIKLFHNDTDLSGVQTLFLYWLGIYSMLYTDLANKEQFLTENVIKDSVRTDAYLVYKRKNQEKQIQHSHDKQKLNALGVSNTDKAQLIDVELRSN